jgi:lysozyme family protein
LPITRKGAEKEKRMETRTAIAVHRTNGHNSGEGGNAFRDALTFTLRHEGGISYDKRDPGNAGGNATAYGIVQSSYDRWRTHNHLPPRHVSKITSAEVQNLYYEDYYLPLQAHILPEPLAIALFDTAVNVGVGRATKLLQQEIGVRADGRIGPRTRAALNRAPLRETIRGLLERRRLFYRHLAQNERYSIFLRGWLRRVSELERIVLPQPKRENSGMGTKRSTRHLF